MVLNPLWGNSGVTKPAVWDRYGPGGSVSDTWGKSKAG
jgi:hypothetical protein